MFIGWGWKTGPKPPVEPTYRPEHRTLRRTEAIGLDESRQSGTAETNGEPHNISL